MRAHHLEAMKADRKESRKANLKADHLDAMKAGLKADPKAIGQESVIREWLVLVKRKSKSRYAVLSTSSNDAYQQRGLVTWKQ